MTLISLSPYQLILIKHTLIKTRDNYTAGIESARRTNQWGVAKTLQAGVDELSEVITAIDLAMEE